MEQSLGMHVPAGPTASHSFPRATTVPQPRPPGRRARIGLVATSLVLAAPLLLAALSDVVDILDGRRGLGNLRFAAEVLVSVPPLLVLNRVAAWLIAQRRLDAIGKARGAILLLGAAIALCADFVLVQWADENVPHIGAITTSAFWVIIVVVPVLTLRAAVLGGGAWGGLHRAGGRPGDWLAASVAVLVGGGMLTIWLLGALIIASMVGYHGAGGFIG